MDRVGFDEDRVLVPRPQSLLLDSKLGGRGDALFSPSMATAEGLEHSSQQVSSSSAIGRATEEDLEEKGERSDRVRTRTRPARRRRGTGRGRLTCGRGVGRLARPVVAAVACWPCCSRELAAAKRLRLCVTA